MVEGGELGQLEPLGERDDGGVHCAQQQVGVALYQLGDAVEVRLEVVDQGEPAGSDVGEEGELGRVPRRRSSSRHTSVRTVDGTSSGPGWVSRKLARPRARRCW